MKIIVDGDVLLYQSMPKAIHTLGGAKKVFLTLVEKMQTALWADETVLCFSTNGANFRKNKYVTYKANRKFIEPNPLMAPLKEWAMALPDAIGSPNGEADDYIMIEAMKCHNKREDFIICSIDKDLKTIPSTYYNMLKREVEKVSQADAYDFMMQQFITGDAGDGIAGLYGYGPVKARKILDEHKTYEEQWNAIKELWIQESTKEAFDQDTNLVFIRRYAEHLEPLAFSDYSWDDFKALLGIYIQDNEQD